MARTNRREAPGVLSAPPDIAVDDISKTFDGEVVLDKISFSVRAGRTLIIMGPSGVGKTTLTRILLGLLDPDEDAGSVTIGGRDVLDASPVELRALRQGIGTLLGGSSVYDSSVFASLNAWENVRYPLSLRDLDESDVDERAWRRMEEFELTDLAERNLQDLSAGTRRRVALARAFVEEPPLLVLDDPGAAMDLINRTAIISSIRRAQESTSATVVLTCHDIEMARTLGDDMIVLLAGRVVAAGPVDELLDGVVDAATYDERFKVQSSFALSDALSTIDRVMEERRYESTTTWIVYATLLVMAVVTLVALFIGFFFLGWTNRW